jgi:beta-L-N-acetylhexosaminidase
MPEEGYKLSVTPDLITLSASQPNGFFYGVQTIFQLLPRQFTENKRIKKQIGRSLP